jgi:hypothetical protein
MTLWSSDPCRFDVFRLGMLEIRRSCLDTVHILLEASLTGGSASKLISFTPWESLLRLHFVIILACPSSLYEPCNLNCRNWDSSVGIVSGLWGWMTGWTLFYFRSGKAIFLFPTRSRLVLYSEGILGDKAAGTWSSQPQIVPSLIFIFN